MANIDSNLKLINTGNIPTTSNLAAGEMAFGKITNENEIRLFVNDNNSITELLINIHNNLNGREKNDCHSIDAITGLRDIIEPFYGIEWDVTESTTACKRIGSLTMHQKLPIQSKMRRCLLKNSGIVNYYLGEDNSALKDDGTPATLDGTDGQVMVEIPEHWRKFEMDGNKRRVYISETQLAGFHFVPKVYRSAYEAAIDRTDSNAPKLASVVNTTAAFRGGTNISGWDNEIPDQGRSLLGRPGTSYEYNLTDYRAYARRRGDAGKNNAGWNCDVYDIQKTCYWLYVIEYANFNSQAELNETTTVEGYSQGGLGDGVTTLDLDLWQNWNYNNPFIPCGYTNSLGNKTGIMNYTMPTAYGEVIQVNVPSWRGLENPFGHIYSFSDGCIITISPEIGTSSFYVCDNPGKYQDYDYYQLRGLLSREPGYIKEMLIGAYGENMPKVATGASSTTYFSDYFYTYDISLVEGNGFILFGGAADNGTRAGFGCSRATVGDSGTAAYGTRLCFIP